MPYNQDKNNKQERNYQNNHRNIHDEIIETEAWDIEGSNEDKTEDTEWQNFNYDFKSKTKAKSPVNLKFIFERKIITVPMVIIILLSAFSVIVWLISAQSPKVADFFTDNVSFAMRFILTSLTSYIPFSVAELLLYISVPAAIYLSARFIYRIASSKNEKIITALKGLTRCIAFLCGLIFIFNFTFSVCYSATPINEKMGFDRRLIKPDDLAAAMEILITQANKTARNIEYAYITGSTAMPYNINELNIKLNEAYTDLLNRHNITKQIKARVKPVILSVQMSKMHITGIYSPFTGEANVNVDFPDFNLPFTAAHEMSHLMGIAREDEANFTAFLVCLYSDDNYIRYSGLVNIIRYLQNPLYQADEDKYFELMDYLNPIIIREMTAYREFFNKYRDTQISQIASTVNDTYLKVQRQEAGEKSYGLVVDLATIYILEIYDFD